MIPLSRIKIMITKTGQTDCFFDKIHYLCPTKKEEKRKWNNKKQDNAPAVGLKTWSYATTERTSAWNVARR